MILKRLKSISLVAAVLNMVLISVLAIPASALTFNQNYVMSDTAFNDTTTRTAAQIDAFLNGFSGSCISTNHGFKAPEPIGYNPNTTSFSYGGDVSAGTVIYDSAQVYGLNPEVILATLQKEESLVTGSAGCSSGRYVAAMGNDCPDSGGSYNYSGWEMYSLNGHAVTSISGTCVNTAAGAGFSRQVIGATWKFKYWQQHAIGNVNWNVQRSNFPHSGDTWDNSDDPGSCNNGYMTPGNWALGGTGSGCTTVVQWSGVYPIDNTSVTMETGATAALYTYTPHLSGNQSFFNTFVGWFGNPNTPCFGLNNISNTPSGRRIVSDNYSGSLTELAFTQLNNTGSACTEVHVLAAGGRSWIAHYATALPVVDPSTGQIISGNIYGNIKDELTFVAYSGTNGMAEIHIMSSNYQGWTLQRLTDLSGVTSTNGTFVAGDFLGRGYTQLAYIAYAGGNGNIEIHLFDPTLHQAIGFHDVITNLGGASASTGTFVAGDFLGRGYSQLAYVTYGSTEVHLLDIRPGTAVRLYEVPTNLNGTSSTSGTFVAGNFIGRPYNQLMYVAYSGASGYVETHLFTQNLRSAIGYQDIITPIAAFDPSQ